MTVHLVDVHWGPGGALEPLADPLPAQRYREQVVGLLAAGRRFAGLWVGAGGTVVRTLFAGPAGETDVVSVEVESQAGAGVGSDLQPGTVPSVVDLAPAAGWDEREAADLYGIDFTGHRPLRQLVRHTELETWTVPVRGGDVYQVAVGPIHAGVIESGHFRFHLVGDRILHLDARLFYKHRGLERAAEGSTIEQGAAYVARACGACAVANGVAYALACEDALGLVPSVELARTRTVLLELERVWNHLNDIAAVCAGVGLAAGNNRFAALADRARRINATLSGHRFLFGSVLVGRSDLAVESERVRALRSELEALRSEAVTSWRELLFNATFADRLPDVGRLTVQDVGRLGTVGPAARAAGLAEDVRCSSPRLAYEGFQAVVLDRAAGDVQARFEQRGLELWQSFDLLAGLLDRPLVPASAEPVEPRRRLGVGRVESPRGATSCVVEWDGLRIERLRLRTGSFANWPSVAFAAADNLLPDFPLINKSFELCYACTDR
jgi:Ni,Fe-hydrogenase III large subunit